MLIEQLTHGFVLGSIYALIAVGYSLIYGVMRMVNFAHGDLLMVGGFMLFYGSAPFGSLYSLLTVLFLGLFSMLTERLIYRPLRRLSESYTVVAAICLSLFLQNAAVLLFSADPKPLVPPFSESFVSHFSFPLCLLVTALLLFGLYHTRVGIAIRAVATDSDAAALSGVRVGKMFSLVFFLSGMTAALSALLYTSKYPAVYPLLGAMPGLKAYTASVIGGIGSLPGAILGGLLLGILETLLKGYVEILSHGQLTAAFADGVIYALLLLMLLFRPRGLLGKEHKEKV